MSAKGPEEEEELARVGESAPPELAAPIANAASPIGLTHPDLSRVIPTPNRRAALLALQRTAGNAHVVRMLERRAAPAAEERAPATPDALEHVLLAHERAHAERRNGGETSAAVDTGPVDRRLARSITRDLMTAQGRVLARDDKSGSASQPSSCLGSSRDDNALMREEAEEFAKRNGIELTPERDDNPKDMPVGYKPHFHIKSREAAGAQGNYEMYSARSWYVMGPDDSKPHTKPDWGGHDFSVTMDKEGLWAVVAEIHVGDKTLYLDRQQYIVSKDKFADEAFKNVDKADYVTYRLLLNQERSKRAGAELDQSKPAGAYITNEGPNAANPAPASVSDSFSYLVHPDPKLPQDHKPVKYRWWAIPHNTNMNNFTSRTDLGQRTQYKDEFAFYLGEGEQRSFRRTEWATIEIVCELIDQRNQLVDTARYFQVIMSQSDLDQVEAIEKMAREGAANYRKIVTDKAQGLKAMHLDVRRGKTENLVLFYGPSADDPSKTMLIDLTPGAEYVEHEGKDLNAAIKHLDDNNSYGEGEIVIQVAGEAQPRRLHTTGESDLADKAHKTGIGSMILVGLGVIAGLVPGVDVAAPFLITAGLGTGAASAGLSLADELRKAKPSATNIALDVTAIVGSFMGMGTTIQAARMGSVELAMATATGRFFIYTGFTFDASGGILLVSDTADKIEKIRASTTMTNEEKIDAIEKLIVMAAVTGGLIAFGGHDIATAKTRVTGILGEERLAKLRPDQVYTLQALDDRVLAALKRLPEKDFEPVATALSKDPRRAAQLSKAYGEKFVNEVRANPGRSLQETGELLGAEIKGLPATAVGGTRGPTVYKPDPTRGIGTSKERFERGITSTKAGRMHGSEIKNVKVDDKTKTLATLDLKIGSTDTVSVAIELKETSKLTAGPHSATGGPGPGRIVQLEPPSTAGGNWKATVELDAATSQDDVKFVLGHELDEIAGFIKTKGAAGIGSLKDEAEAGVFVTWATRGTKTPAITSHDRANAREFLSVAGDLKGLEKQLAKNPGDTAIAARVAKRRESLEQLITNMGLRDPQNIELKLAILRDSLAEMSGPARDELMAYTKPRWTVMDVVVDTVERSMTVTEFAAATAGKPNTSLTELLVSKMRAQAQSRVDFLDNGLYGGHYDTALREFIDANPTYAIVLKSEASHGGVTYRAYDQYRWNGTGPPPARGSAGYPGVAGTIDPGWELARRPKSTFDNPSGFFDVADDMLAKWKKGFSDAELARPMKSTVDVKIGSDPDLMVAYSYDPPPTPDKSGTWNIGALYIDDKWIAKTAAGASTPTPAPGAKAP
jgi:hypothetical protein